MENLYFFYGLSAFLSVIIFGLIYVLMQKNGLIQKLTLDNGVLKEQVKNLPLLEEKLQESYKEIEGLNTLISSKEIESSSLRVKLDENIKNLNEVKEDRILKDKKIEELLQKLNQKDKELEKLKTTLEEQRKSIDEKIALLEENKQKLTKEFHSIATEILDKNSEKFAEQNKNKVSEVITPVKLQIEEFKKRVDDIYDKESKERSMLFAEINMLKDLNRQISQDAINLTNALKNQSKQQGIWGEMILERVLESSGLREGYEYEKEVTLKSEDDKRFRPDVIVKLPGDREIVIDAKTSLSAYEGYISSNDKIDKERYLSLHLKSIKEHIKELSNKEYEKLKGINSLDFIFMFVPVEGALLLALDKEPDLYDKAFKEHIVLVSPTTLLVALRAVENSWRYEKQAQNIKEVTKRAEALYGKFVGFVKELELVGKSLKKADESYNEAIKKLSTGRGNIIRQITLFKDISNISPKNELPKELVDSSVVED